MQYGGPYPEWDDEVWWLWKHQHQHPHCADVERSHGHLEVSQLTDYMPTREVPPRCPWRAL
ncbi:hypothetical protein [Streptomyces sp. NBC_00019]|uniref:hypothetical protein n=1 Tax=Streptomyces sp. NBC_00019 TaxID=2975623 RepID=UPI003244A01F